MWFSFFITWEQRKFGEVFTYERPDRYIVASDKYSDYYSTPVLTANKGFILGYTNEQRTYNHPCVIFDDFTLDSKYVDFPFMVKSSALKILTAKQGYYLPFAYELLHAANIEVLGHARHYISVVQPTAVLVPNYPEQLRIGKFIEAIDNLITLHQRKQNDLLFLVLGKKSSLILANDWEQRKLGDIGKTYGGLSGKSKEDFGHGDARFVTYMNVFSNPVGDPAMTEAIELDGRQNEVKKGDIFFTTSSETPEEVGMSCVWMENMPNTYLNSFCFGYRPIVELDLYYLAYVLRSSTVRHKFIFLAQGISRYNISKNKAMEMLIPVPNMEEQVLLGAFFKNLDNLITLHQCKENLVQNQYSVHSLFQMQYKLAGDWEQRKFGEYFEERNERSGEGELISVTINSGIKKFNELGRFDSKPEDLSKYKRVEVGDIAYNSMRMWQGASGYSPYAGILSPAYTVITPKNGISSLFFAYLIKRPSMIHLFEINSQGLTSDTWNLKFPAFSQIEASAPFSVDEQDRIAEFFAILDNLITLHQCKRAAFFDWKSWPYSKFEESKNTLAWEQRKARDLFDSYADKGYPELPVLSATQDAGMVKRDEIGKSVFHDKSNEVGYKRVLPGQFVIHLRSFQGGFAHSNIEGITSPAYTIFGFKPTEKQYDIFWKYIFSSEEFVRRLETVTYGIRDGRSISYDEFLTMGFIVPSYAEQVKIAHGLIITDNLITLHQRGKKYIGEIKNDKRTKTE